MNDNVLRDKLISFKDITEKLIYEIEKEQYESIGELFSNRQKIINDIESINCSKEKFTKIASKLQLLELNKKLEACFYNKKNELKFKMNNLMQQKNANNSYIKNSNKMRNFFSTKA